jgi:hypothetical protein
MAKQKHPDSEIIDRLGGTSVVAKFTELTTGAISQWRHNGMPEPWKKYFQTIRPDAFKDDTKK